MRLFRLRLLFYSIALCMQALGVALMLKSLLGASPYGIFIANLAILLPITVGVATFIYNLVLVLLTAYLSKKRIRLESFGIMFIISLLTDAFYVLLPDLTHHSLVLKIIFLMLGLTLIDLNKILFQLTRFISPPLTDFFFAFSHYTHIKMNIVVKLNSVFNFVFGIIISYIINVPFNQVGYGTIVSLIYLGSTYKIAYPYIERFYHKLTREEIHV